MSQYETERDMLAAVEPYRIAIRKACAIFLKHNAFCECAGCTDIALRLAPSTLRVFPTNSVSSGTEEEE